MLARLIDQIAACEEEVALARLRAIMAGSAELQADYRRLEKNWLRLSESLRFAEQLSGFIEWRSQRLQAPPP